MQIDMHFYSTYAIARLAGFVKDDAGIIANSAQFVDDATDNNSEKNEQQEMLFGISTAHHLKGAVIHSTFNKEVHRLVWVPFHFYPGGKGSTLEEKLLCVRDSDIVNEMFDNHIELSDKEFYLHLLGIASHVYLDTFSHYGFSGICSSLNEIVSNSIKIHVDNDELRKELEEKETKFYEKYKDEVSSFWNKFSDAVKSATASTASSGLGHGAVMTYPDKPFLTWEFNYKEPRYGQKDGHSGKRDNKASFLDGLEKLYGKLKESSKKKSNGAMSFPKDKIERIIAFEGNKKQRVEQWQKFINEIDNHPTKYVGEEWNKEKDTFESTEPAEIGNCYRFHQAAAYHRWYTLKDLLPKHKIYAT